MLNRALPAQPLPDRRVSEYCDMKILLQNIHTRQFYCLLDIWTSNPVAAFNFRHSIRALEFVRNQKLSDVQMVVKFQDSQWDEIVPLPVVVAEFAPRRRA